MGRKKTANRGIKMTTISFETWKNDYTDVPWTEEKGEQLAEQYGIYSIDKIAVSVRVYNRGGYIECLKDGTYTMGLNLEILDSDTIEPLEKKLFAEHDGINKKKA